MDLNHQNTDDFRFDLEKTFKMFENRSIGEF